MHPRFTIHTSCAASRITISSAVRPEGKLSSTVSIQSGRDAGARFWKKNSPSAPFTNRFNALRRAGDPTERPRGDGEVVADQVELRVPGCREEHLVRVRDGHLAAGGLEDLLTSGHIDTIGGRAWPRDPRPPNRYPVRVDFYRTREGKTLRIGESDDGMLSVEILKDGAWTAAPLGMIGLRLSPETRRLKASEIKTLPN